MPSDSSILPVPGLAAQDPHAPTAAATLANTADTAGAATGRAATTGGRASLRRHWLTLRRDPLLHFLLLGALLFAVDARLHPPRQDEHTIVVTRALRQSFIDNYDEDHVRKPSEGELQKMIDAWVGSEILYREGKAMGVDRGDTTIRDRIAYKLQLLIFDQVRIDQASDAQLTAWFARNHERFDVPEMVGFYLTPATDETTARQQLAAIEAGRESEDLQRQTRAMLGRPVASIAPVFGEPFRTALLAVQPGHWQVLQANDGWHVVRLDSHRAGKLATLADVREEAARLWHTEAVRAQAWEAVKRLKTQYTVRIEP